jgi:hypothetical protein
MFGAFFFVPSFLPSLFQIVFSPHLILKSKTQSLFTYLHSLKKDSKELSMLFTKYMFFYVKKSRRKNKTAKGKGKFG